MESDVVDVVPVSALSVSNTQPQLSRHQYDRSLAHRHLLSLYLVGPVTSKAMGTLLLV